MKNKVIWIVISLIMLFSLMLFSCGKKNPSDTADSTFQSTGENWWNKLGEPQYGGTLTYRVNMHTPVFDPGVPAPGALFVQYEPLVSFDWTVDRLIWPFNTNFAPIKYYMGILAESWEKTDPLTLTIHLRKGIRWQNVPPVNGREFTAEDVQQHYDRMLGTGSGYNKPSFFAGWLSVIERVTAADKYTAVVKFKSPSIMGLFQLFDQANENQIEPPEVAKLAPATVGPPGPPKPGPPGPGGGGGVDWKNAAGTGPWMQTGFVAGSSITYKKNPDYWGYDERHPQNRIPYIDTLKILIIPDTATALAAIRTAKIDLINNIDWQQAANLRNSNPDLKQIVIPVGGNAIDFRVDKPPFTDIRVRKALQMAIDRESIAKNYYSGLVEGKPMGLISTKGYYLKYEDWPQKLKDEYGYNPAKAKQLLAEAGYPNGFKTNIVAASNVDLQLLQGIKSYFANIGVDMKISVMDFTTFRSFVVSKKHDQMSYSDMSQSGTTRPPINSINFRHSKEKEMNLTMTNDPKYDALAEKFKSANTEADAQKASQEADRYALENHWTLYTMQRIWYNIWQPWLKGYSGEEATGGGGVGYGVVWARLWIDQDLKKSMGY